MHADCLRTYNYTILTVQNQFGCLFGPDRTAMKNSLWFWISTLMRASIVDKQLYVSLCSTWRIMRRFPILLRRTIASISHSITVFPTIRPSKNANRFHETTDTNVQQSVMGTTKRMRTPNTSAAGWKAYATHCERWQCITNKTSPIPTISRMSHLMEAEPLE